MWILGISQIFYKMDQDIRYEHSIRIVTAWFFFQPTPIPTSLLFLIPTPPILYPLQFLRFIPTPLFAFYTHSTSFYTHSTFCVLYPLHPILYPLHFLRFIPTPPHAYPLHFFRNALIFYSHQFSIKILLVCDAKTFSMYDVVLLNANNSFSE